MNFSSNAMSSTIGMTSSIIVLSEELRAAHRGASYHAATPKAMPLKVDVHSTDLVQLMRKRFAQTAALITAHNPASKKQTPAKNKKASIALQARIEALSLGWLPGHRKAFKEGDPVEDGFLVFGITGGQLEALMVEFDQEVALWCPSSGTPVLMLHPLARRNYSAADIAWEKLMKEAGRSAFVRPTVSKEEPAASAAPAGKTKVPTTVKARTKKEPVVVAPAVAPVAAPPTAPAVKPAASKRSAIAAAPATVPAVTPAATPVAEPAPERKTRAKRQVMTELQEQTSVLVSAPTVVAATVIEKPVRKTRVAKAEKAVEVAPPPVAVVEPAATKPAKLPRKPKAEAVAPAAEEPKVPAPILQAPAPELVVKTSRKKSAKV